MSYSDFTIAKVKRDLGIQIIEGRRFIPDTLEPIAPSSWLSGLLAEGLPLALSGGSEKFRSELIIAPVLLEVRRILDRQISLFSGIEFSVDPERGLSGICDFLLSRSTEQLVIEAPAIVIIEAKKLDIAAGIGQCIAEMVAAQQFNQDQGIPIPVIYGSVSIGTAWKLLNLEGAIVTLDLTEYTLPPVDQILSILAWMCKGESLD